MILKLRGIRKTYPTGKKQVLKGISLKVPQGRVLGLAGESGSGKSTLLKIIAGREIASKGKMRFHGDEQDILRPNMMQQVPGIRYIDQDSKIPLNIPVQQILEKRLYDYKADWRKDRIRHLVKLCQLKGQLDKRPEELSGGQRQRVALALAIADEPQLILLDEAFTSLDYSMKHDIQSAWVEVMKEEGITAIMVTHDPKDALMYCDEIAIMHKGKIIQQDNPRVIYHEPKDRYTAELFGPVTEYGDPPRFYRPEELRLKPMDDRLSDKTQSTRGHDKAIQATIRPSKNPWSIVYCPSSSQKPSGFEVKVNLIKKYFQGNGWLYECVDEDEKIYWVFGEEDVS
jgi:iron(III) transport system ATP-binding protein